jgi:hypothetical protein
MTSFTKKERFIDISWKYKITHLIGSPMQQADQLLP